MEGEKVLNYVDPPNDVGDQLINAGIQAGFAFFTTEAGIAITQICREPIPCLIAGFISAGLAFFSSLIAQRGLRKSPKK